MTDNLYLPKDTFEAKPNQIDNFALRLNKYHKTFLNKFVLYRDNKIQTCLKFDSSKKQILAFSDKYLLSLQQLPELKVETSAFKPDWRLIIGLGSASVYETSITLHHIYGFPYIPGQAVKGVTRNYVICECFEKDEEKAENNPEFKAIFGSQEQQGKITFFDAYPQTEPKLDFDIMNVHYKDYYGGKDQPTDDQKLNPITFLTVKDTTFFFPIGFPQDQSKDIAIEGITISELIRTALEEKGIGAKTSVGYGYLKFDESATQKQKENELKNEKEKIRKQEQQVFEAMPELDKQLFHLSEEKNLEKAKYLSYELFNKLDSLAEAEKQKTAEALKEFWQKRNFWQKQKKKQKDRVKKVKQILGE
ncbi:MAG: hypothetical protein APR54_06380 [Candidatus Cloacimonas sp. SDB]|nr:MAG: hypothetical protein APR54_06380 [Candidatus Cloacimonas sp. SDB]